MWKYDYITHHGIKGQQWGVRNGPPYPIEDKVLKKGTRLNSISARYFDSEQYRNNGKWMYTYNPDDKHDRDVYRGPFSKYLVIYRGAQFVTEHKYETIEDLKMPNKKERIDAFKKIYDRNRNDVIGEMKQIQKMLVEYQIGDEKEQKEWKNINLDDLKTSDDFRIAYDIFNHAMEASYAYKSTREYVKYMERNYDAMVDDNNQGTYNDAHDPIIIFRANQVLKTVQDESFLTNKDILDATARVREELEKKGKSIKL